MMPTCLNGEMLFDFKWGLIMKIYIQIFLLNRISLRKCWMQDAFYKNSVEEKYYGSDIKYNIAYCVHITQQLFFHTCSFCVSFCKQHCLMINSPLVGKCVATEAFSKYSSLKFSITIHICYLTRMHTASIKPYRWWFIAFIWELSIYLSKNQFRKKI